MRFVYKMIVSAIILVLVFGIFDSIAKAAAPDQRCDASGNGFVNIIMPPDGMFSQAFTPQKNRLTRVKMLVSGDGFGTVGLLLFNINTYVAMNSNGMQAEPSGRGILTFEFDDIEMISGWAGYRIKPFYSVGNKYLSWYFDTDCYAFGNAYQGEMVREFQLDFATYGYDYVTPEDPADSPVGDEASAEPSDGSDSSGITSSTDSNSSGTTSTPTLKTISSNIKAPKTVTAEDLPDDQGGAIKVTWDKSLTSSIDGYQVYRKDNEEGEFEAIIAISSDGLNYIDQNAKIGTTYYYSVRAYEGDFESKDSSIVEAESIDNLAPAIPTNFKIVNQRSSAIKLKWDANFEDDLDGYLLTITERNDTSDFAKTFVVGKDQNEYILN